MRWLQTCGASLLVLMFLTGFAPWSYAPPGNVITVPLVNKDHPSLEGLVAWWVYYPKISGGGTVWRNLVSPYHGTLTNMAAGINGTSGWANTTIRRGGFGELRFDGSNDYITVPGTATPYAFNNTSFTVSLRFKVSTTAAQQYIISQQNGAGGTGGWIIRNSAGGLMDVRLQDSTNSRSVSRSSNTTISTNTWYDLTVIFKTDTVTQANNDVTIYLNGLLDQTSATNGANPYTACSCDVDIGIQGADHVSTPFTGSLDDIRIYKRALGLYEIARNRTMAFGNYAGILGHIDSDGYRTAVTAATSRGLFLP